MPFIKEVSADQDKVLYEWNNTHSPYLHEQVLPEIFENQVAKSTNKIALHFGYETLTYEKINGRANQIAHFLRSKGVKNNSIIALCIPTSFELLIVILGILKSGAAYLPLDPTNPEERQKGILEEAKIFALITHSQLANNYTNTDATLIKIDTNEEIDQFPKTNLPVINTANDLAYVIYTSGSTGKPKGVMLTHKNVNNFIHWFSKALTVTNDDIFDFSSSISFDFAVATTLFPLMAGAQVAICADPIKPDPYQYWRFLQEKKVTMVKMTPSYFKQLKEIGLAQLSLPSLRYIIFGGEKLFSRDILEWVKYYPKQTMLCEYGPTEAAVATSWIKINSKNIGNYPNSIPIGKPALNTQLFILDENLLPVEIGQPGELYIGGDGVAAGYLNQPEITRTKFIKNPFRKIAQEKLYKTGDICRYLPDGNIEFIERKDHQIKISGFRIELDEIEHHLFSHPEIKDVAVIAVQNPQNKSCGKKVAAFCVMHSTTKPSISELRTYLAKYLPYYMIPAFFRFIDTLPLLSNGKLDRAALETILFEEKKTSTQTKNEIERKLIKIWREVLNVNQISLSDNFFELGGNSLNAVKILILIRKRFNKEITIQHFYNSSSIQELASIINSAPLIKQNNDLRHDTITPNKIPLNDLQFLFWLTRLVLPKFKLENLAARKRFLGTIDPSALEHALNKVYLENPILGYHIPRYSPYQYKQNLTTLPISTVDISHLSIEEGDKILSDSYNKLHNYQWHKYQPMVKFNLFFLRNNQCELQISLSHFISDKMSMNILFSRLSHYYLAYKNNKVLIPIDETKNYINYIIDERVQFTDEDHTPFWDDYLSDTVGLSFETTTNQIQNSFTTYLDIPSAVINNLSLLSRNYRLTIADILAAATALGLKENCHSNSIAMNVIKSTRENEIYNNTIGLFVTTDMIKVNLRGADTLIETAKQVQTSRDDTQSHQGTPIILKLSSLLKSQWQTKTLQLFFCKILLRMLSIFISKETSQTIMRYIQVFLGKNHQYFIDLNIMHCFILDNEDENLFGFASLKVPENQIDKIVDKQVINIWFNKDNNDTFQLIVSANLNPQDRERIAKNILEQLKP